MVSAEKSRNTYMMHPTGYTKSLSETITKTYKKSNQKRVSACNIETKKIADKVSIDDKIEKFKKSKLISQVKTTKRNSPVSNHLD